MQQLLQSFQNSQQYNPYNPGYVNNINNNFIPTHNNNQQTYTCDKCELTFNNQQQFTFHMQEEDRKSNHLISIAKILDTTPPIKSYVVLMASLKKYWSADILALIPPLEDISETAKLLAEKVKGAIEGTHIQDVQNGRVTLLVQNTIVPSINNNAPPLRIDIVIAWQETLGTEAADMQLDEEGNNSGQPTPPPPPANTSLHNLQLVLPVIPGGAHKRTFEESSKTSDVTQGLSKDPKVNVGNLDRVSDKDKDTDRDVRDKEGDRDSRDRERDREKERDRERERRERDRLNREKERERDRDREREREKERDKERDRERKNRVWFDKETGRDRRSNITKISSVSDNTAPTVASNNNNNNNIPISNSNTNSNGPTSTTSNIAMELEYEKIYLLQQKTLNFLEEMRAQASERAQKLENLVSSPSVPPPTSSSADINALSHTLQTTLDDVKSVKKVLFAQFKVDEAEEKRERARVASLEESNAQLLKEVEVSKKQKLELEERFLKERLNLREDTKKEIRVLQGEKAKLEEDKTKLGELLKTEQTTKTQLEQSLKGETIKLEKLQKLYGELMADINRIRSEKGELDVRFKTVQSENMSLLEEKLKLEDTVKREEDKRIQLETSLLEEQAQNAILRGKAILEEGKFVKKETPSTFFSFV